MIQKTGGKKGMPLSQTLPVFDSSPTTFILLGQKKLEVHTFE